MARDNRGRRVQPLISGLSLFTTARCAEGCVWTDWRKRQRPTTVTRLALQAPIAPRQRLGHEAWSAGQDAETREYMARCLEGEEGAAAVISAEVATLVDPANPDTAQYAEAVRQGPWGAVDDELAQLGTWGLEPEAIVAPTAICYDPDETVLPRQHPRWLAEHIPNATLVVTPTLGHGHAGEDPTPDLKRMYGWLATT